MAAPHPHDFPSFLRAISVRQVRLVCGVILFAYVVSHFLNHALGNISVDAMEIGVSYHTLFWQFLPVTIVFYAAALTHMGLGIYALYQRRQFRWRTVEPLQLVLGLSIPALVMAHVIGVRLGQTLYGHQKLYPQELYLFFVASEPHLDHDGPADHRLGARLHRHLFLASPETVLHARSALSARGRRADPDAGAARRLPGRPQRRRSRPTTENGARTISRAARSARRPKPRRSTASPAASPSAISACSAWRWRHAAHAPCANGAAA